MAAQVCYGVDTCWSYALSDRPDDCEERCEERDDVSCARRAGSRSLERSFLRFKTQFGLLRISFLPLTITFPLRPINRIERCQRHDQEDKSIEVVRSYQESSLSLKSCDLGVRRVQHNVPPFCCQNELELDLLLESPPASTSVLELFCYTKLCSVSFLWCHHLRWASFILH